MAPPALSTRQRQVLRLVAEGWTHEEIATRLAISVSTVHHHLAVIRAQCEAPSTTAALWRHRRELEEAAPA